MAVSKRLRYEVLRRDNHTCRYCGGAAPDVALTVDHVVPAALGGGDDPTNLVAACADCNSGKSATPPGSVLVADTSATAIRWAQAMKHASAIRRAQRQDAERHREYFADAWFARYGGDDDLPDNFGATIDDFIAAGLGYDELEDAIEVTSLYSRRDPFRYFCGVGWRKVTELQQMAQQLLESEEG